MTLSPYHLFEVVGVELEYMIVDARSLNVKALTDQVLHAVAGSYESEWERGDISWSNELALHVIELKTTHPATSLENLPALFQENVNQINDLLAPLGAQLMPSAMHPWMDPDRELKLWPHDFSPVYKAFHRLFNCRGHGWANLQSVHLNLPFCGDEEFGALHAAIRLLLPLLPALAASSPILEGKPTGLMDTRLEVYRNNAARIPSVSGLVIPEPVYSKRDYQEHLLRRIYADIAPHDPEGVLQHEWVNARGAIARFDRNAIEIRVLDIQECPLADLAICAAIVQVLRTLIAERFTPLSEQQAFATEKLHTLFLACLRDAEETPINDGDYLQQLGLPGQEPLPAREIWRALLSSCDPLPEPFAQAIQHILEQGTLARRILGNVGENSEALASVYRDLCTCLAQGERYPARAQ
jgi:carboxylate-amine ligase